MVLTGLGSHPSIHCSIGSAPVGVQCPLTSSLSEFPGYKDWFCYPGLSPVLVSIAFFLPSISWCFSFTLPHLPLNFTRVSSLRLMYLPPLADPSLTFSVSFQAWDWLSSGTRCYGPRGGAVVRIKQKSRFRILPWP